MPEIEVLAALAGVAFAVALWAVTNIRLSRGVKAIQADIDSKRTATQVFVDERLSQVEALVGGMEARLRAEMPPNVDGRLDEVHTELTAKVDALHVDVMQRVDAIDIGIQAALRTLDVKLQQLPETVRMSALGSLGAATKGQTQAFAEAAEELEGHVAAALPEMMDSRTVLERELLGWMRKPIDAKLEETNPTAALLQRLAKYGASNWLTERRSFEGGSYREASSAAVK